jgi:hypothetical protein
MANTFPIIGMNMPEIPKKKGGKSPPFLQSKLFLYFFSLFNNDDFPYKRNMGRMAFQLVDSRQQVRSI